MVLHAKVGMSPRIITPVHIFHVGVHLLQLIIDIGLTWEKIAEAVSISKSKGYLREVWLDEIVVVVIHH